MLPVEIIKQIRHLQLKAGYLATDALSGEYLSAFKGLGIEFDEVREYLPGDDVRQIDWNVTARMNHPYVKIFREEREMTLLLMIDVSPSQLFGSTGKTKREITAELAAILAFLAINNNDKVGVLIFSDKIEQYIPPKKGRAHIWRIIKDILARDVSPRSKTDISQALDFMMNVLKRRSMCFLISDFFADDFEKSLQLAAKKHDLICVKVEDQRERELPDVGVIELDGLEGEGRMIVDTGNSATRESFVRILNQHDEKLRQIFKRNQTGNFAISTNQENMVDPLCRFLREREKKRKVRR